MVPLILQQRMPSPTTPDDQGYGHKNGSEEHQEPQNAMHSLVFLTDGHPRSARRTSSGLTLKEKDRCQGHEGR